MTQTVYGVPTSSGNGFTCGKAYKFIHKINSLYVALNDNGHERFEIYPFEKQSSHLPKTGTCNGFFIEVTQDNAVVINIRGNYEL